MQRCPRKFQREIESRIIVFSFVVVYISFKSNPSFRLIPPMSGIFCLQPDYPTSTPTTLIKSQGIQEPQLFQYNLPLFHKKLYFCVPQFFEGCSLLKNSNSWSAFWSAISMQSNAPKCTNLLKNTALQ